MKVKDIAKMHGFNETEFEVYLESKGILSSGPIPSIPDAAVYESISSYKAYLAKKNEMLAEKERAETERRAEIEKILITSGFNFEGYKIVKYAGYISSDEAFSFDRHTDNWDATNGTLMSLGVIRKSALRKLKEEAYNLGCDAIIGVDFDYLTLNPEITVDGDIISRLHILSVTANGTAVIIKKIEN